MPSITDRQFIDFEIDFEVVCDDCGTGLCSSTRMRSNVAYVSACPKCIAQKDYEIKELNETIRDLEDEIRELKNQ